MFATIDLPAVTRPPAPLPRTSFPIPSLVEQLTDSHCRDTVGGDPEAADAASDARAGWILKSGPMGFRELTRAQLMRRLHRRMRSAGTADLTDYLSLATTDLEEGARLRRSLHVGASRFFSDPESLLALERFALLALFAAGALRNGIRVLVTGSGSGEEAYSIALLLREYARSTEPPPPLVVHAVENDETLVETARAGWYPGAIAHDLSKETLARYFVPTASGFAASPALSEFVHFHQGVPAHVADLDQLDLIVSRNPVLVMDPVRQDELIRSCHARLRAGGYLLLGAPLTSSEAPAFFEAIDAPCGLYRRLDIAEEDEPAPLSEAGLTERHQRLRTQGLMAYARHLKEELFLAEERARVAREFSESTPSAAVPATNEVEAIRKAYRELEELVAASQAGLLLLDAEQRIRRFSRGLQRLLALEAGDVGRPLAGFGWPCRASIEALVETATDTHIPAEQCIELGEHTYQIIASPVEGAGTVCSFVDVTPFRRADEWLALQGRALDQMPDPVILTNRSLQVLFLNEAASRRYRIDRTDATGKPLGQVLFIDWLSSRDRELAYNALVKDGVWIGRQVHRTRDGRTFEVETAVGMLIDASGEEIGLMISARDLYHRYPIGTEALRQLIVELGGPSAPAGPPEFVPPLADLRPSRPPRERLFRS